MADKPFDTLAAAQKLKAAGIAEAQAEAIAETQAEAARAARNGLMTKLEFWSSIAGVTLAILIAAAVGKLG